MPCIPFKIGGGTGILCVPNEPVEIRDGAKVYLFEWTGGCGWLPVNKDGSQRLSPVPRRVWKLLYETPESKAKEESHGTFGQHNKRS